jgi:oligopeptide transport system permease protein
MIHLLLRKFLRAIAILLGVMLFTFLLIHAIPGNPWSNYSTAPRMLLGISVDKALQSQISHHFGLDLPMWRQFTRYIIGDIDNDGRFFCGAVCGNLGPSIRQRGRSVQHVLFAPPEGKTFWQSRFGYSIRLVFFASLIVIGLGIPLGMLGVLDPRSRLSRAVSVGLAAMISIPNFILGLLAIIVFASWLKVIKVLPDQQFPL